MIARIVAVMAGIWLMFSPAVLGYDGQAAANDRIFGPTAAAFAFVAIWEVVRPLRWGVLPVGIWLVAAPFILGYGHQGAVSSVLSGLVLVATTFAGADVKQRYGGGWRTLVPGKPVPGAQTDGGR